MSDTARIALDRRPLDSLPLYLLTFAWIVTWAAWGLWNEAARGLTATGFEGVVSHTVLGMEHILRGSEAALVLFALVLAPGVGRTLHRSLGAFVVGQALGLVAAATFGGPAALSAVVLPAVALAATVAVAGSNLLDDRPVGRRPIVAGLLGIPFGALLGPLVAGAPLSHVAGYQVGILIAEATIAFSVLGLLRHLDRQDGPAARRASRIASLGALAVAVAWAVQQVLS